MNLPLALIATLSWACAFYVYSASTTVMHEILAAILFVGGIVAVCGVAVCAQISQLPKNATPSLSATSEAGRPPSEPRGPQRESIATRHIGGAGAFVGILVGLVSIATLVVLFAV